MHVPKATDQWKDHIVYIDEPLILYASQDTYRTYDVRLLIESYTDRGIVVLFDRHDLWAGYIQKTDGH